MYRHCFNLRHMCPNCVCNRWPLMLRRRLLQQVLTPSRCSHLCRTTMAYWRSSTIASTNSQALTWSAATTTRNVHSSITRPAATRVPSILRQTSFRIAKLKSANALQDQSKHCASLPAKVLRNLARSAHKQNAETLGVHGLNHCGPYGNCDQ